MRAGVYYTNSTVRRQLHVARIVGFRGFSERRFNMRTSDDVIANTPRSVQDHEDIHVLASCL